MHSSDMFCKFDWMFPDYMDKYKLVFAINLNLSYVHL